MFWLAALLLVGCTVVKINPDATDSVEHAGGDETGRELANRACHKSSGGAGAEVISTQQKEGAAEDDKALASLRSDVCIKRLEIRHECRSARPIIVALAVLIIL